MFLTRDTSHLEISPLNTAKEDNVWEENMWLISVILDTPHCIIGPCGLFQQSPSGDNSRHVSTASWSSAFDCGKNAGLLLVHTSDDIDPDEPLNIAVLVAFEFTQGARQSCCWNDDACKNM
jgi:hypothetical protein